MDAWNGDEPANQVEFAREYTRNYPENGPGWIALADVLVGFAQYDEARAALRRAERSFPEEHQAFVWIQLGHLYKEKGNYPRAELWYRRAVNANPTTRTLIHLGALLARRGCFAEAKRCHRKAIRLATDPPDEAHYNLGLILRAEGRYESAIENFDEALRIDPKYEIARKARKDCIRVLDAKGLVHKAIAR